MLEVALFGVGYIADIFVFFRLVSYLMVILVFKVLPCNFMFHQNPPAVYKSIHTTSLFFKMWKNEISFPYVILLL
jgi:hypothetical protein